VEDPAVDLIPTKEHATKFSAQLLVDQLQPLLNMLMASGDHGLLSRHVPGHVVEVNNSEYVYVTVQNLQMEDENVLVMTKTAEIVTKQDAQLPVDQLQPLSNVWTATGAHGHLSRHVPEHVVEVDNSEHVLVTVQNLQMEDENVLVMTNIAGIVTKQNVQ